MSETAPVSLPIEKLVRVYIKIRDAHVELKRKFDEEDAVLLEQMDKVKSALLTYCKDNNIESVKTSEGLFYRTVSKKYWTSDWESMGRFILDHEVPELLEKRIHQGNMRQFLEENPDLLPPGLNVDSEYTVTVRRNK